MIFTKKRTYKQHDNEKDSFYKFSAKKLPDQSKITESFSTDICIIGAGLTGISSALHLMNKGLKEGKELGVILKFIEEKWINDNFKINESEINSVISKFKKI